MGVPRIEDLAEARVTLARLGALSGQSDHGATKSLYGRDPDGNEFEVMWMVPRDDLGSGEFGGVSEGEGLSIGQGRGFVDTGC